MADYIKQKLGLLVLWLVNFRTKLSAHGPALRLTPEQVTELETKCTVLEAKIELVVQRKNDLSEAVQDRNDTMAVDIPFIRKAVERMKTEADYTAAIGEDLDIIGEVPAFDPLTFKPIIKVKVFPGYRKISFNKDKTDGVNIYRRPKGTVDWGNKITFDTNSPYDDYESLTTPGVPQAMEYSAIAVIDDHEIGLRSDIVEVVYGE